MDRSPGDFDEQPGDDDGQTDDDNGPPAAWLCGEEYYGVGDGCDCGCGSDDPDCGDDYTAADCVYESCSGDELPSESDPTQCEESSIPSGWTCATSYFGAGDGCDCGCGALDTDCGVSPTTLDCEHNNCGVDEEPSDTNPALCVEVEEQVAPEGWDCPPQAAFDANCTCGCGAVDPACPADYDVSDCHVESGCLFTGIVDPSDPTQCIDWDCDAAQYDDGATCDCGCGNVDPDCEGATNAEACDATHCADEFVLESGDITSCMLDCAPAPEGSGDTTCSNHGYFAFGGFACESSLSACDDGRTYAIACEDICVCSINDACVGEATNGFCSQDAAFALNASCGWSLTED